MGFVSLALSVIAFLCAGLGFLTAPIPWLGLFFSLAAPTLAVVGAVLGGRAMSAQKRAGQPADLAKLGVILNCIAFVPALLVALTCGVCNALFSSGDVKMQRNVDFRMGQGAGSRSDGGVPSLPPPSKAPAADPQAKPKPDGGSSNAPPALPTQPAQPSPPAQPGEQPTSPDAVPQPAPSMPPPPLPAGPRSGKKP